MKGYKFYISSLLFAAKQKLTQVSERCALFGKFSRKGALFRKRHMDKAIRVFNRKGRKLINLILVDFIFRLQA